MSEMNKEVLKDLIKEMRRMMIEQPKSADKPVDIMEVLTEAGEPEEAEVEMDDEEAPCPRMATISMADILRRKHMKSAPSADTKKVTAVLTAVLNKKK